MRAARWRIAGRCAIACALLFAACGDSGSGPDSTARRGSWQQLSGGLGESGFRAVWGTSIDTLLATGTDVALAAALDGGWRPVALPGDSVSLRAIWASSPQDIVVAGESGAAFHFDGNTWSSIPAPTEAKFVDLCAAPSGEVFACIEDVSGPAVLKRTGTTWELFAGGFPEISTIWASDSQTVYVAGADGYVARFDGEQWRPVSRSGGLAWLDSWGTSPDDVFFVGDGGQLGRFRFAFFELASPVTTTLRSISGNSASHIFAVGDDGTIVHFNGTAWAHEPSVTSRDLRAVHVFEDGRAVALGELGTMLSFDGQSWSVLTEGEPLVMIDASGVDAGHVFFAGRNHSGDGMVRHIDGRTWTFAGEPMRGIWARRPDEAIVVGTSGAAYHFDGAQWIEMTNGALSHLNSVHGSADGARAYAVGDNGNLRYSNAPFGVWNAMVPPLDAIFDVRDVWAAADDDVFAIGPSGTVMRYRGGASLNWTPEETGLTGAGFTAITGRHSDDVTAVASDGRVYHYNGSRWQRVPVPETAPWVDVAADLSGGLLAVSSLPNTLLLTGFDVGVAGPPVYLGRFHACWTSQGTAFVAGDEGTIFRYRW